MSGQDRLWLSLPVPALRLGPDERILDANPAAEDFLNLSAKSLNGAALWDRLITDAPLAAAFVRARANGTPLFVNEVGLGSAERPLTQCSLQYAPLTGTLGEMLVLITPHEMAHQLTLNSQSGRAAKSAIGMAEMLAHEIKNPLAGITGAAQLLAMELGPEDQELTALIVDECRRIVKLLEQVEEFGNLSPPAMMPVNIHDVLDRTRQSASVGFGAHMRILADYDPSLPDAWADADQLQQILLNLVKNAAEAGASGGTIRLRTFYDPALRLRRRDGGQARLPLQIEVIDDGPGLPPDIAAEVFEPFVSGRENGTGLGLALVAKLVAGQGGWITVDSTPGRTVFRLSLAVASDGKGES